MTSPPVRDYHIAYCGGHACAMCHRCSDWYFGPDGSTDPKWWHVIYSHHLGPLIGPRYRWHRRPNATCGYHAYPHYVHYVAYHGECPYTRDHCPPSTPQSENRSYHYPLPAHHGPHICHCKTEK